jgi:hypothetical protein
MFGKIETSLLEGDIQSGSFTKKMTLDAIVGLIAWLLVERSGVGGGGTKERSNVAGAKYNNSWRGVGRKKVCDTIRQSHPWIDRWQLSKTPNRTH